MMFHHRGLRRRARPRGSTVRRRRVRRRRPWGEIVIKLREEVRVGGDLLLEGFRDPEGHFRLLADGAEPFVLPDFLRTPTADRSLAQSFPRLSRRLHGQDPGLLLGGTGRRGSLDLYLRLRLLRPEQDLHGLLRQIRALPFVEYVVPTSGASVQPATIPSHPATSNQLYLEPSVYGGVDAVYAWMSGADGSWDTPAGELGRVKVCVLERDMCVHADLPEVTIIGGDPVNPSITDTRHGTRTCGVLGGRWEADPAGATGLCHAADFYLHTMIPAIPAEGDDAGGPFGEGLESLPRSIDEAIELAGLGPGDVLAIEMHVDPLLWDTRIPNFEIPSLSYDRWPTLCPVEILPDVWEGIRRATEAGITVVQPAGNGGGELAAMFWHEDGPGSPALPLWDPAEDSGAILVGAGASSLPGDVPAVAHERLGFSNWGDRVDCQGWGEHVFTTDCPADGYADHSGTSSATAMVAGVVAALQSGWYRHYGQFDYPPSFLSPSEIRKALRDNAFGSPQPDVGRVGPLPDLCLLLSDVGIVPDPFLRDTVGDDGQAMTLADRGGRFQAKCPDVVLRQDPIPSMSPEDWEAENPADPARAIGPNHLRVRVRNRGAGGDDPEVVIYWSEPSAFLHPKTWKKAGAARLPFLGPHGAGEVVVPWDVPPLEDLPVSLVVQVRSGRDRPIDAAGKPIPPLAEGDDVPTQEFLARVVDRNDLRIRNVQEVQLPSRGTEAGFRFHFRGVPEQDADYRLVVRSGLPAGTRLTLHVSSPLRLSTPDGPKPIDAISPDDPWTGKPVSAEYGLHLTAGEDVRFDAHVTLPADAGGGVWRSSVDQYLGDQFLGRMEFVLGRNTVLGII